MNPGDEKKPDDHLASGQRESYARPSVSSRADEPCEIDGRHQAHRLVKIYLRKGPWHEGHAGAAQVACSTVKRRKLGHFSLRKRSSTRPGAFVLSLAATAANYIRASKSQGHDLAIAIGRHREFRSANVLARLLGTTPNFCDLNHRLAESTRSENFSTAGGYG